MRTDRVLPRVPQSVDTNVAPWTPGSNTTLPQAIARLFAAATAELFANPADSSLATRLGAAFGGYGDDVAKEAAAFSPTDETIEDGDEADNLADSPSADDCKDCLATDDANISCRWAVSHNDVDLGRCVYTTDKVCGDTSPSPSPSNFAMMRSSNQSLRALLSNNGFTGEIDVVAIGVAADDSEFMCLTMCCAANCNRNGQCQATDTCQCNILHTGPLCEDVNLIFVIATSAVGLALIGVGVFLWVREEEEVYGRRA